MFATPIDTVPHGGDEAVIVSYTRPLFCKDFEGSEIALKLLEKVIEESWEADYLLDIEQFDFVLNYNLMLPNEKFSFNQIYFSRILSILRLFF